MFTQRNLLTLWFLLLPYVPGRAYKFNLFEKNLEPREGDVRLFGSNSIHEGRVEVYHDGRWGTVCDDNWDMTEAQVVCRQLSFPGAKSVVTGKDYGQAPVPIWLDEINCKGTESHLVACVFKKWGETDCSHKEDVGVICETGSTTGTISDSTLSLDHSISLSDDFGQIFDSGNGCDFLIFVQSATGNKKEDGTPEKVETTICAHKIILSRFPLLSAQVGITNITVNIRATCQPHFTSFIRYMYTRKMDVTFSSALCIHWMASNFGVKQLMEDVGRLFSKILPDDNSFHNQVFLYEYAVETEDLILKENCIQYLAWNYQNLTGSPAWTELPVELLAALLVRSDLVVPDEYFVLQTLERWIKKSGNSASLETQADLLSHIRFPMIPAEKLFELESASPLYTTHKNMYRDSMLKAFEFNVLLFSNLTNTMFNKENGDYQPRIYTAEPWSTVVDAPITAPLPLHQIQYTPSYDRRRYGYDYRFYPTVSPYRQTTTKYFSTPIHNSLIFKDNKIQWVAKVLKTQQECSYQGLRCESLPVARLAPQNSFSQQSNILFRNQLILMCQGKYICQVQGFKGDLAPITANGTQVFAYPCPGDQYSYQFVVRPEYI
ncbi:galectin-3-binding protein A-like [Brachyistius frenatus]|uniref:galectin-3-binding protein A-like n=1 Tax=Brachyistius frenatus TaxID=100188 RepID=UPI0037E7DEB2